MNLKVEIKQASKKDNRIIPVDLFLDQTPETVRELITETVLATKNHNDSVSDRTAVETALQAFDDGLVVLFIDGERHTDADEKLELRGNETLCFVKLAMLVGRMW